MVSYRSGQREACLVQGSQDGEGRIPLCKRRDRATSREWGAEVEVHDDHGVYGRLATASVDGKYVARDRQSPEGDRRECSVSQIWQARYTGVSATCSSSRTGPAAGDQTGAPQRHSVQWHVSFGVELVGRR